MLSTDSDTNYIGEKNMSLLHRYLTVYCNKISLQEEKELRRGDQQEAAKLHERLLTLMWVRKAIDDFGLREKLINERDILTKAREMVALEKQKEKELRKNGRKES